MPSVPREIKRAINRIIFECSATPSTADIGLDDLNVQGLQAGNKNLNGVYVKYNYVIRRDGTIQTGVPDDIVPLNPTRLERDALTVCLIGGIRTGLEKPFTQDQHSSVRFLIKDLQNEYGSLKLHFDIPEELL